MHIIFELMSFVVHSLRQYNRHFFLEVLFWGYFLLTLLLQGILITLTVWCIYSITDLETYREYDVRHILEFLFLKMPKKQLSYPTVLHKRAQQSFHFLIGGRQSCVTCYIDIANAEVHVASFRCYVFLSLIEYILRTHVPVPLANSHCKEHALSA